MTEAIPDRRAFIGAGGALLAAASASAATPASVTGWQPTFEPQDRWLDIPARHRMLFDTVTAVGAWEALGYASNYYAASTSGYGIEPADLAVVIVLRHFSTPVGFDDSIWAKYGTVFADKFGLEDKQAADAAHRNPFRGSNKTSDDDATLTAIAAKGARFAVCATASKGIAGLLAKQTGGRAEDIEHDFATHLVRGGVSVPAGIVAVNRAQERGYAFSWVG